MLLDKVARAAGQKSMCIAGGEGEAGSSARVGCAGCTVRTKL